MVGRRLLAGCAGGICSALAVIGVLSTTIIVRQACYGPPSAYICPVNGVPYISQGWALTLVEPLVLALIVVVGHILEHRPLETGDQAPVFPGGLKAAARYTEDA